MNDALEPWPVLTIYAVPGKNGGVSHLRTERRYGKVEEEAFLFYLQDVVVPSLRERFGKFTDADYEFICEATMELDLLDVPVEE